MLMATKKGKMITYLEWPLPIKSHNHISHGFVKSLDKLKQLYIH